MFIPKGITHYHNIMNSLTLRYKRINKGLQHKCNTWTWMIVSRRGYKVKFFLN